MCVGTFVHVDSRCGHVSILCFRLSVHFGFWWVIGQKMSMWWFPMYWRICFLVFVLFVCLICLWLSKSGLINYDEFVH